MGGDPLLVVAGADLGAPFEVGEVPRDGALEAGGPGFGGLPAEIALDLGAVDGVAAVVAGAVLDEGDEFAALLAAGERRGLGVDEIADFLDDAQVGEFVAPADVVGAAEGGLAGCAIRGNEDTR